MKHDDKQRELVRKATAQAETLRVLIKGFANSDIPPSDHKRIIDLQMTAIGHTLSQIDWTI